MDINEILTILSDIRTLYSQDYSDLTFLFESLSLVEESLQTIRHHFQCYNSSDNNNNNNDEDKRLIVDHANRVIPPLLNELNITLKSLLPYPRRIGIIRRGSRSLFVIHNKFAVIIIFITSINDPTITNLTTASLIRTQLNETITRHCVEDFPAEMVSIESFGERDGRKVNMAFQAKIFFAMLNIATAIIGHSYYQEFSLSRGFNAIFASLYYLVSPSAAARKSQHLFCSPNAPFAQMLWDLPDSPFLAFLTPLILPSVTLHHYFTLSSPSPSSSIASNIGIRFICPTRLPSHIELHKNYSTENSNSSSSNDSIGGVRSGGLFDVNCDIPLHNTVIPSTPSTSLLSSSSPHSHQPQLNPVSIIIHFHGGGFIGMASFSHQVYTRVWARETNLPLFSIDYRKAPQHPYPSALDDCYAAYRWIVTHAATVILGRPLHHIYLVGDSAGGHLATCVVIRAIRDKVRLPTKLLLVYPALLSTTTFSPSRLHSINDPMVPFNFLLLCLNSYCGAYNNTSPSEAYIARLLSEELSPLLVPQTILNQFPSVYIQSGALDPLHDDSVFFADRCLRAGVLGRLVVYKDAAHGYLNLLDLVPATRPAVMEVVKWIK